jgi:capsular polysaccharide transport system permease protein
VHGFPSEIQHRFAFNPLFQCVEYLRYSYYSNYPDELLDGRVFWFATIVLAACFFLERLLRRQLLSA